MTLNLQLALWAIAAIFLAGGFYADLRSRLSRVEKMLGNGTPGVFVRRNELREYVHEILKDQE